VDDRPHLRNLVEVAHAHEVLVFHRFIALTLGAELPLLQLGIGRHAPLAECAGQREHRVVERMERAERDELELVTERAQVGVEVRDLCRGEVLAPVE
jgi:hypothetical protein